MLCFMAQNTTRKRSRIENTKATRLKNDRCAACLGLWCLIRERGRLVQVLLSALASHSFEFACCCCPCWCCCCCYCLGLPATNTLRPIYGPQPASGGDSSFLVQFWSWSIHGNGIADAVHNAIASRRPPNR